MSVAALLFGLMASVALAATPAHAQASFPSGPVRIRETARWADTAKAANIKAD